MAGYLMSAIKNFVRLLRSLRFTVFLIICLASVFLLGVVIPQKDLLGNEKYLVWKNERPRLVSILESAGLTDIYTSPLTIMIWGLFFLNLVLAMMKRIPGMWKRTVKQHLPHNKEALHRSQYYEEIEGKSLSDVLTVFRKNRYHVVSTEKSLWAVRNRYAPLATIFFHLSFFLVLVGAVLTLYTRFRAEADVAVGETFSGNYRWVKTPKIGKSSSTVFRIEEVTPTYYKGNVPLDLKIVLQSGNGVEVIGINKPYKEGDLSFVVKDIDIAALFILRDRSGNDIEGGYVKLIVLGGNEDSFRMGGYEFRTTFYPDIDRQNNAEEAGLENIPQMLKEISGTEEVFRQREIINPAFHVAVTKDGSVLSEKTIRKNEPFVFNNHILAFEDLNYWVRFYVGRERGLSLIYTGFILITVALAVRFIFYRRDIEVFVANSTIYLSGKAEFYPDLFRDEFNTIIDKIKAVSVQ